jgi:hypothetical protein
MKTNRIRYRNVYFVPENVNKKYSIKILTCELNYSVSKTFKFFPVYFNNNDGHDDDDDDDNNNSIQFFIIYVPSQHLQGKLQTQHSVNTINYIMDTHNNNNAKQTR